MQEEASQHLRELIRVLIRNLGVLEKEDAACCGVTIGQCHAIVEIGRQKEMTLIDLAEKLNLDKSTMSRTVNKLVEAELAGREVDADNRRYVSIHLTEAGTEVFQNIEQRMAQYYLNVLKAIPQEKQQQVLESLLILSDAVKKNPCCESMTDIEAARRLPV